MGDSMTTYTIEEGIPVPEKISRAIPPKSAVRLTMEALQPGQSFLIDQAVEYDRARAAATAIPDGSYVTRKIPGQGWRVWRVE
jgi:hypothetical protein